MVLVIREERITNMVPYIIKHNGKFWNGAHEEWTNQMNLAMCFSDINDARMYVNSRVDEEDCPPLKEEFIQAFSL